MIEFTGLVSAESEVFDITRSANSSKEAARVESIYTVELNHGCTVMHEQAVGQTRPMA